MSSTTMGDGFAPDCLVIYIEEALAKKISNDDIEYDLVYSRRAKFKLIQM
jgi:hypothetical protein